MSTDTMGRVFQQIRGCVYDLSQEQHYSSGPNGSTSQACSIREIFILLSTPFFGVTYDIVGLGRLSSGLESWTQQQLTVELAPVVNVRSLAQDADWYNMVFLPEW